MSIVIMQSAWAGLTPHDLDSNIDSRLPDQVLHHRFRGLNAVGLTRKFLRRCARRRCDHRLLIQSVPHRFVRQIRIYKPQSVAR
jgi:hypothetical protein